jgi:DNA-binding transcriptional LysR family regulator
MNIKALRLFCGVVESGSLTEAAERLNTSASAASRLLSLLEADLGLTLFSRQHRRLELTEQGREFYRRSQHILKGIDELRDVARDVGSSAAEPLRLVSTAPIARSLIVPALAAWRAAHPHLGAMLDIETRFDMESKVAAREYNLGVVSMPQENAIIDLEVSPLASARYEIALPCEHPLAERACVPVEALAELPLISLRAGQRWRRRMEAICTARGVAPRIAIETGSTLIALELVRRGAGAMVVDRMCSMLAPEGFALRPLEPEIWTDYAAITGAGGTSAQTRDFIAVLRERIQAGRAACADAAACMSLA